MVSLRQAFSNPPLVLEPGQLFDLVRVRLKGERQRIVNARHDDATDGGQLVPDVPGLGAVGLSELFGELFPHGFIDALVSGVSPFVAHNAT